MAKNKQALHPQGTLEWYRQRWGKITMSSAIRTLMDGHIHELNKLLDFVRWQRKNADDTTIRQEYERETILGDRVEAMAWGRRHEQESIYHYELSRGVTVIRPGFVTHPLWPDIIGDSTDFIETHNGDISGTPEYACEIKCPHKRENHLLYLRHGMPPQYHHQTQGHMEIHQVTNGKFVSYDPRHPIEQDKIYVQLLAVDPAWQTRFRERADEFARHIKHGSKFEHAIGGIKDGIPSMF